MKVIKSWGSWGLPILAVFGLLFTVFLAHPSDAIMGRNQRQIEQSIIEEVRTAEELGLNYLGGESGQLIADNTLLQAIYQAEEYLAVMPEDIPLRFDLGTNYPIRMGWLANALSSSGYEALGYVNVSGLRQAFRPTVLRGMLANVRETLVQGNISAIEQMFRGSRIPTLDLIARDQQTDRTLVIREVNAIAVCRDALNAVLNQTLRENRYERLW